MHEDQAKEKEVAEKPPLKKADAVSERKVYQFHALCIGSGGMPFMVRGNTKAELKRNISAHTGDFQIDTIIRGYEVTFAEKKAVQF